MAVELPTRQRLSPETKQRRLHEMKLAIADGSLVVRQMTTAERHEADAARERCIRARAERAARRSH
jgi:hypothetical protein